METLSVRCNHCGAPLTVGGETRFVTCQFCNSQLEVKRTESSVFTEEISKIAEKTDQMAESLEVIKLQNEVERLDREWQASQPTTANGKGSKSSAPASPQGAVFGCLFTGFFALVCFSMAGLATNQGAPGIFALVPVGMGVLALIAGISAFAKSQQHQTSHNHYQQRRKELITQLDDRKNP